MYSENENTSKHTRANALAHYIRYANPLGVRWQNTISGLDPVSRQAKGGNGRV